jgi:hypothetical protein
VLLLVEVQQLELQLIGAALGRGILQRGHDPGEDGQCSRLVGEHELQVQLHALGQRLGARDHESVVRQVRLVVLFEDLPRREDDARGGGIGGRVTALRAARGRLGEFGPAGRAGRHRLTQTVEFS